MLGLYGNDRAMFGGFELELRIQRGLYRDQRLLLGTP
jgi:hypothetical protein